jgi:hypothetical protein
MGAHRSPPKETRFLPGQRGNPEGKSGFNPRKELRDALKANDRKVFRDWLKVAIDRGVYGKGVDEEVQFRYWQAIGQAAGMFKQEDGAAEQLEALARFMKHVVVERVIHAEPRAVAVVTPPALNASSPD